MILLAYLLDFLRNRRLESSRFVSKCMLGLNPNTTIQHQFMRRTMLEGNESPFKCS